jgi:hypothetical protein
MFHEPGFLNLSQSVAAFCATRLRLQFARVFFYER